ncbi:hypothetical protein D3P96_01830 [Weissella viridescens]|uniref:ABC-2 type transporter transmembrane domain-containing protein n=1 Tax=Weissella viridescens TaxID=1629 RepID=A0A3P2RMK2_WEIVI|nr:ABC transporter permease [Weissella viridescens]RRG18748.1 hypothetical protein D3P96_01830 [Weissella viridescens]
MYAKLIKRNLLIYTHDKMGIFFSFLGMFISLLIYIFFLRNNLIASLSRVEHVGKFVDTWMVAGLISIVALTTTLNAFGQEMEDRRNNKLDDFSVNSGLRLSAIKWIYTLTAIIEGLVSTIIFAVICFGYLSIRYSENAFNGHFWMSILFNSLLVVFSANFFTLISSCLSTMASFSALSAIVGTLAGFLSGTYIVYDALPKFMQTVLNYWPGYEIAAITRNEMMHGISSGVPNRVLDALGVSSNIGRAMAIVTIGTIICLVINYILSRTEKK